MRGFFKGDVKRCACNNHFYNDCKRKCDSLVISGICSDCEDYCKQIKKKKPIAEEVKLGQDYQNATLQEFKENLKKAGLI